MLRYGLTQAQFGEKVGVSGGRVSHWLKRQGEPGRPTLKRIAKAFEVKASWLMGDDLADDRHRAWERELLELIVEGSNSEAGDALLARLKELGIEEALKRLGSGPNGAQRRPH